MRSRKTIRSFMRSATGSAAIEFAFLLPVLLVFLMGIIEYNMIMYASAVLQGATVIAAREGKTGYTQSGMSQQDYIYGIVRTRVTGLLDTSIPASPGVAALQISSKSYASYNAIGQPEPCISPTQPPCPGTPGVNFTDVNHNGVWDSDEGSAGLGGQGDIVVYTVTYSWHVLTPIMSNFLGTNGVVTLSASSVAKNEPYNVVSSR